MPEEKVASPVKKRADKAASSPVVEDVSGAEVVVPAAPNVPVFRDTVFTSRTLVVSDEAVYPVARGRIEAITPELLACLQAHPDFERIEG